MACRRTQKIMSLERCGVLLNRRLDARHQNPGSNIPSGGSQSTSLATAQSTTLHGCTSVNVSTVDMKHVPNLTAAKPSPTQPPNHDYTYLTEALRNFVDVRVGQSGL
ncbi:hypothetical protein MN608_08202 [Microdochium nivale]|nr:hypothetical protein MN608_08202 [Microdochium nivale]